MVRFAFDLVDAVQTVLSHTISEYLRSDSRAVVQVDLIPTAFLDPLADPMVDRLPDRALIRRNWSGLFGCASLSGV